MPALHSTAAQAPLGLTAPPRLPGREPTAGCPSPFPAIHKTHIRHGKTVVPYAPGTENRQKLTSRMALMFWCHTQTPCKTSHIKARCWHSFYLALHFLHRITLPGSDCLGCIGKRYAKLCGVQSRVETRADGQVSGDPSSITTGIAVRTRPDQDFHRPARKRPVEPKPVLCYEQSREKVMHRIA